MKTSYEYTKKDLKKYLLKSRTVNNIILFIVGLLIYLYFTYNNLKINSILIYILIELAALFLLNLIYLFAYIKVNETLNLNLCGTYKVELTPNKFSVTVNKKKTDYKYKDIKKLKEKRDYFIIKFKGTREYLTFERKIMNQEDYTKMIEYFKNKIN